MDGFKSAMDFCCNTTLLCSISLWIPQMSAMSSDEISIFSKDTDEAEEIAGASLEPY